MDWNNKDDVLEAVKQDGWVLRFASDSLKSDKEVVLTAVRENGWALVFASDSLKSDKEVILTAVRENKRVTGYAYNFLNEADKSSILDTRIVGWVQFMFEEYGETGETNLMIIIEGTAAIILFISFIIYLISIFSN